MKRQLMLIILMLGIGMSCETDLPLTDHPTFPEGVEVFQMTEAEQRATDFIDILALSGYNNPTAKAWQCTDFIPQVTHLYSVWNIDDTATAGEVFNFMPTVSPTDCCENGYTHTDYIEVRARYCGFYGCGYQTLYEATMYQHANTDWKYEGSWYSCSTTLHDNDDNIALWSNWQGYVVNIQLLVNGNLIWSRNRYLL